VLAEHPLDGHRVRRVHVQPGVQLPLDLAEAESGRHVGRGAHHADLAQVQRPADGAVDDTQPAPGQSGVDSEHAHVSLSSEHLFGER
jgi:hypothetical protein